MRPLKCQFDYEAVKNAAGKDFIEYTSQISLIRGQLHYDFLTDNGHKELDFMMMYLH